jgi:hypothetical protein
MRLAKWSPPAVLLCVALSMAAQEPSERPYSRLNTFSSFFEYSNDSSHIILGNAENRKIGALGFQYQRRLVNRRLWNLSFTAELRPGMLESDPTAAQTEIESSTLATFETQTLASPYSSVVRCRASKQVTSKTTLTPSGLVTVTTQIIDTCSRTTAIEQGFSPGGARINLLPHHRLQPTFSALGGYIFSTHPVPIGTAGYFNFSFEFGAGLEFYRSHSQSIRLEYQVQHYSNHNSTSPSSTYNPGVDSGIVKLTYAFGR